MSVRHLLMHDSAKGLSNGLIMLHQAGTYIIVMVNYCNLVYDLTSFASIVEYAIAVAVSWYTLQISAIRKVIYRVYGIDLMLILL